MAVLMKNIRGTNNAFEYSTTIDAGAINEISDAVFIPSNVATITFGLVQKSGVGGYKVQTTYSTRDEVDLGNGEWFDWEIEGIDSNGFLHLEKMQWWLPIPSHIRIVVEGDAGGTQVYFAMRAN